MKFNFFSLVTESIHCPFSRFNIKLRLVENVIMTIIYTIFPIPSTEPAFEMD